MNEVSVIGCGRMGSALIEALVASDTEVTIWNRTREKAEALTGPGVTIADTVGEALAANSTIIVCISNYEDTQALLDGQDEHLQGKTVVQLCSGRPDEAQALSERVTAAGGTYLDGSIMAYPHEIGTDSVLILYSGDEAVFQQIQPLVEAFGGTARFVGENPRGAAIREWALNVPLSLAHAGISHGAKICEREDVSLDWYTAEVQEYISRMTAPLLHGLQDQDVSVDPEQTQNVRVPEGLADMATYLHQLDIDSRLHEVMYERAAAGFEEVPREPET